VGILLNEMLAVVDPFTEKDPLLNAGVVDIKKHRQNAFR
jgi:hypothetical protein